MASLPNGPCACGECGVFKKTTSTNNLTERNIRNINMGWIFNKAERSFVNLRCRGHSFMPGMVIILYLLIRVIIIATALLFRVMARNWGFIYC